MAEAGSVSWQFKRTAYFGFPLKGLNQDKIFELAVDGGAEDVTFDDDWVEIVGSVEAFKSISDALKSAKIEPEEAELRMTPVNETELDDNDTVQILKMIEALEELDDVQNVFSTLSISDSAMAQLEAA
jgi:transcriptional/translational regulatory protein YebC/TACO1